MNEPYSAEINSKVTVLRFSSYACLFIMTASILLSFLALMSVWDLDSIDSEYDFEGIRTYLGNLRWLIFLTGSSIVFGIASCALRLAANMEQNRLLISRSRNRVTSTSQSTSSALESQSTSSGPNTQPRSAVCRKCGFRLQPEENFCRNCGWERLHRN